MKAAVCRRYGPPENVKIETVEMPVPKAGEVLIRVKASTVSSGDWRIRAFAMPRGFGAIARIMFGFTGPRKPILGTELAGEIAAVGSGVARFKIGEQVVAFPGSELGCHAEYRTMSAAGRIVLKPQTLTTVEAAAMCFGGATALYFLRDAAKIKAGERVLVIGASGAVGSAAIQIAKVLGAEVVHAVTSGGNADLLRSLGATRAIDYAKTNVVAEGRNYDVVLDCVGLQPPRDLVTTLNPGGRLILIAASLPDMVSALMPVGEGRKIIAGPAQESLEQMETLATLVSAGQFRPVVDHVFSFERIAAAHARVETGRKRGSVVVTISS